MFERTSRQVRVSSAEVEVTSKLRTAIALIAVVPVVLKMGWTEPLVHFQSMWFAQLGLVAWYIADMFGRSRRRLVSKTQRREFDRASRPEQVLILVALAGALVGLIRPDFWPMLSFAVGGLAVVHLLRVYLLVVQSGVVPPGLVFMGSFIVLIGIGVGALMLPAATHADNRINVVDALFTITSAISQTGLVVRPTGQGFTRFGQIVILIWIQVGALGVIVFGALLANVLGSGFGLKATQTLAEGTEQGWAGQLSMQKLVAFIILFTHAVELIGAGILYIGWPETWDGAPDISDPGDRLFHALFFSVSAFCNAGFVTTDNSLGGLRYAWTSHAVIVPLIVFGSIGFPVLDNIRRVVWARIRGIHVQDGQLVRLNLNSKIVLTTALILYVVGFGLLFLSEVTRTTFQEAGSIEPALIDAHFMNMNRTAGFDTIDVLDMGLLSQLVLIAMMFIGGSPGSVAGGIKLMALAVLALTVWSTIMGRRETTAFGRTLPEPLIRKCAVIVILFIATVLAVGFVLTLAEHDRPDGRVDILIFETVSAVGTCGWSMGATPELSPTGRVAITVGMFVGRVGPLAVTASLVAVARRRRVRYSYPEEEVVVY